MSRRFATLVAAFTLLSMLLAACGGATEPPTAAQPAAAPSSDTAAQPTAATSGDTAVGPTAAAVLDATPAPNDATPIPLPTPAPETSLVGSGATKIVWWHINTQENERDNWKQLTDAYVQQHPNVSIEITVLENEAFKTKLATAMQSGSLPDLFQSWGGGVLKQYAEAGLVQDLTELYYDQYLPPAVGGAVVDSTQALFAGQASPEQVAKTIEESAAIEITP